MAATTSLSVIFSSLFTSLNSRLLGVGTEGGAVAQESIAGHDYAAVVLEGDDRAACNHGVEDVIDVASRSALLHLK